MDDVAGNWASITGLLEHAGQPFADTSLFAVNAVCRLMRQQVTVALSGDGGDEGFGGYDFYRWIESMDRLQALPPIVRRGASILLTPLSRIGAAPKSLPQRIRELDFGDDTAFVQSLFSWMREQEHRAFCLNRDVLPLSRLFEPQWQHQLPAGSSRLERLSMLATEVNVRLLLPNEFLFKVDTASMKESLEVRVPLLDEDLFAFTLSLPHHLKVTGRTCKKVLRNIALRRLPAKIAAKEKKGFCLPVDKWVNSEFKARLKDELLGASSKLPNYFRPNAYRPVVEAFCDGENYPGVSRENLYHRIIMLLSVHLALSRDSIATLNSTRS
jgi:asparagine synthase (glutamine-hydrolysing)